jgi:hypothetical protein
MNLDELKNMRLFEAIWDFSFDINMFINETGEHLS